ncbi:hypothetical protein HDU87_004450 [Geranomyces variabilis]|uniref:Dicer-like protein 1 n=1 Tax=Geranomyces variabilis TaxID=109894 RepID=A0AAD5XPX5_9FUNG|nr:hypothetical protein HDU87_004450 [Geranomyces variabilis]
MAASNATQNTESETRMLLQRPRPYQVELFQHAMVRNIIAYLDTGSGKTLVSVMLIQEYATPLKAIPKATLLRYVSKKDGEDLPLASSAGTDAGIEPPLSPDIDLVEYSPGVFLPRQPKKVVFLVPTVPLVAQQAAKIRDSTELVVGEYSRDEIASVTHWDAIGWYHEVSLRQVLVLTPQIFHNILSHGFVNLERDISLLIVDECHHAIKLHPYNVLMKDFFHTIADPGRRPKVFGMTASPIHQRVTTRDESFGRLKELQQNMGCVVVTVADRSSLQSFIPKAAETIVEYEASTPGAVGGPAATANATATTPSMRYYTYWLERVRAHWTQLQDENNAEATEKLRRTLEQLNLLEKELGSWLAGKAAEDTMRGPMRAQQPKTLNALRAKAEGQPPGSVEPLPKSSAETAPALAEVTSRDVTPKVLTLLRLLEERAHAKDETNEAPEFRAMIFVERRLSAKVLSEFLNLVATERFPIIKASFVTGHGGSGPKSVGATRSAMNSTYQKRAFDRFRTGQVNTLVVTRVGEEGVDIPACRLIVVFDIFRSHTGYVQSRGRARDKSGSEYLIMVQRNNIEALRTIARAKVSEVMTRSVAEELGTRNPGEEVLKSEYDNDTTDLLLGSSDQPLVSKAGATITAAGAVQLLRRYCRGIDVAEGYALEFDHRTGTAADWQRCLSFHADPDTISSSSLPLEPYGYAFSFAFPSRTALFGEILHGPIRGTRKLAQQSVALAACRRLYEVGALNEHLLPNINFKRKGGAFSLPSLLARWRIGQRGQDQLSDPVKSLTESGAKEEVLAEYQLDVPQVFRKDDAWLPVDPTQAKTLEASEFYVTVLSFGEEIELYTRGRPDDVFQKTISTLLQSSAAIPRATFKRTLALVTRRPIPAADIPRFFLWLNGTIQCAVEVVNWCPESPAGVAQRGTAPVPELEDEEDDDDDVATPGPAPPPVPVVFDAEQIKLLWEFQQKFWDLTMKRTSVKPQASADTASAKRKREDDGVEGPGAPATRNTTRAVNEGNVVVQTPSVNSSASSALPASIVKPFPAAPTQKESVGEELDQTNLDEIMYMVLPMYGISDASSYTSRPDYEQLSTPLSVSRWLPDWNMVRKVVDGSHCVLYDWIINFANVLANGADVGSLPDPAVTEPAFEKLYGLLQAQPLPGEFSSEAPDMTTTYDPQTLERINEVLHQGVAYTPHNGMKYVMDRLLPGMHPSAAFTKTRYRTAVTYAQYVERNGYTVNHPESAMVQAHHSSAVKNLCKPARAQIKLSSKTPRQERDTAVHLVPEAVHVLPFPRETYRLASVFPSVLHKLDIYCAIDQFKQRIGLPHVTIETLFAAFSAPSAQEETNYERLETLGDSYLKFAVTVDLFKSYPNSEEGDLSARRSGIVSNKNLYARALELGLGALLNVTPFNPRSWAPPGGKPFVTHTRHRRDGKPIVQPDDENDSPYASRRGPGWRLISQKMLADFVEALIGAYYTDGGNDVAASLLHKSGLASSAILSKVTRGDHDIKDSRAPPPSHVATSLSASAATALPPSPIEHRLQYRFQNRAIILEALTHPSLSTAEHTASYQRLEFLGDAVLDWVLTRFFFNSYPHLAPSALSDLRQAAVNNESFARLAHKLNLHASLRHSSTTLQTEIDTYVAYLDTLDAAAAPINTAVEGPKVLGDLFEAVAGAVFVDSGFDLEVMWRVFKPLMIGFLDIHVNPEVVKKSPIRQFHEFFQKLGFAVNDVRYTYETVDEKSRCELHVLDVLVGHAEASSKQLAKRWATFAGLEWIEKSGSEINRLLERSREMREI